MKKLVRIAVAAMLVLAMTVSVFAAYNGSVYQGQIPDFVAATITTTDGKTETVYSWELLITPAKVANVIYPTFQTAYNEVKGAKDLTALVPGLADKLPAGVGASDLVVRDMFDVRYVGTEEYTSISVTLKPTGVTGNDTVFVLHKGVNGWEVVPSTVAWDGTVTATFTDLSPVAIVTLRTAGVNANGPTSPATGDINVACGVVAAAALLA